MEREFVEKTNVYKHKKILLRRIILNCCEFNFGSYYLQSRLSCFLISFQIIDNICFKLSYVIFKRYQLILMSDMQFTQLQIINLILLSFHFISFCFDFIFCKMYVIIISGYYYFPFNVRFYICFNIERTKNISTVIGNSLQKD